MDSSQQGAAPAPPPYPGPPQEGAYPAQGGAYPAQNGAYPPQGGAYPPQSGAYPPQGSAYPPQNVTYLPQGATYPPQGAEYNKAGAYPPQGGAYPPQGGAYPPHGGAYPAHGGVYPAQGYAAPTQVVVVAPVSFFFLRLTSLNLKENYHFIYRLVHKFEHRQYRSHLTGEIENLLILAKDCHTRSIANFVFSSDSSRKKVTVVLANPIISDGPNGVLAFHPGPVITARSDQLP